MKKISNRKKSCKEVYCYKCKTKYEIPIIRVKFNRHYCKKCRGAKVEIVCKTCKKKYIKYKSSLDWFKSNFCSRMCQRISMRIDWSKLTRSSIKTRWITEFGIKTLICNRCGHDKHYNIQLHHKKYLIDGGKTEPKNLEPLCRNCHGEEHYENKTDLDFKVKQKQKLN